MTRPLLSRWSSAAWRWRHRLIRWPLLLGTAASAAVAYYAHYVAPYWLHQRHERVWLRGLPPAFDGLRILHLSDFHTDHRDQRALRMFQRAAATPADLVALTGDFVQSRDDAVVLPPIFEQLRAPLGVFAVLGNHDYQRFFDEDRPRQEAVRRALADAGIVELTNRGVTIEREGAGLWLAGLGDPHTWRDDLVAALDGRPAGMPTILLAHSPDVTAAAALARVDLLLCGHTHGGQVWFPLLGAPITHTFMAHPEASGLWRRGQTWVNVTSGLGFTTRVRFGTLPEAVIITLHRRPDDSTVP